jgi:hypothetical protein
MKKTVLIIILIITCLPNYSQVINGCVSDEITKHPLSNVNVFFNATTIGTITDRYGNFKLTIHENRKLPIAISAIGYNSVLLSEYSAADTILIFLTPKVYELGEVKVYSKRTFKERIARNHYLNMFCKQFLGETLNATKCEILNDSDLVFKYFKDEDILRAYSQKPLIINNEALGYKIIYFLDTYSESYDALTYIGNYIFIEDSTLNERDRIKVEQRRKSAYLGSRMHFFRALWENNLDSAGYIIKDLTNKKISQDSLVVQIDGSKFLVNKGLILVSYYSKMYGTSIELLHDYVYFDKSGFFDPYGINWTGEMIRQRIADLLPFDYVLKDSNRR